MLLHLRQLIGIFVFLSSLQMFQVKGQCVDQPGVIQNGKTCVQLVPQECYDVLILNKCCHSCTASSTGKTGCEYGDKVANCIAVLCPHYTDPNECCNTCKVTTAAPISSPSTTATTKTGTPQASREITTETTKMTTTNIVASTISSLHVPAAPSVFIVSQTTRDITLNVTIQVESTANEFEVKATAGHAQKIPLPAGKVSLDYIFSARYDAGTCFTLEIVAINTAGRSSVTTVSNACYAPKEPEVSLVTQSTSNVTLNITLPDASLGSLFEVKAIIRGLTRSVSLPLDGSRSVQYVFNETAEAGACFSLEISNVVINNPIKSDETIVESVCFAPKKPEVSLVTQSTSNVTLNITLPDASLGSLVEVKTIRREMVRSVSLPWDGSRSVQYVFNETAEAGTCFSLEIANVVINNPIKSDETIVESVCFAPKEPEVTLVTQSTSNVTLNITLPDASLGSLFEVKAIRRGLTRSVSLPLDGSRSVQYVFNETAEAGACFSLEISNVVINNPIKSDETIVESVCFAPKKPEVSLVTQSTSNVTLNITLPDASLGSLVEVKTIRREMVRSVSLPWDGSRSVQYVFNETAEAGTCFSLEIANVVINNPIKSDETIVESVCFAPKKPEVTLVTQSTSNVTLNITLPNASLGSLFEVKAIRRGLTRSVSLPLDGSRSVQYVFNERAEAGACFSLEISNVVINNPIKSDETIVESACFAPKKPEVSLVTQSTSNVTLNITLPDASLGSLVEVKTIRREMVRSVSLPWDGSRSVQYVFNETAEAGTCFSLEIANVVINNPIKSDETIVESVCFAPKKPEVSLVTQSTSNMTLNITLPNASLGSLFEVKAIRRGLTCSLSLPLDGSRSVQYVFNETAEAGACFSLEISNVVINNPIKSDETIVESVCFAPQKPEVSLVTQSTSNVTLNITLPDASLGSLVEVKTIRREMVRSVSLPWDGSRSVQYVFNETAEAGTCFSLEIANVVINNPIKSDETIVESVCFAPKKPEVTLVTQSTSNVTLNITLPDASLGSLFEVKAIRRGLTRSLSLPLDGSRSVQYVFNETAEAGTCFSLEISNVVINNPIKSDETIVESVCFAPENPEVNVVAKTTRNITMNITLPTGSLGNTFEVKVTGGVTPLSIVGSRSVQHVLNEVAEAGTCFSVEIVTLVINNPIKSDPTVAIMCYVPLKPEASIFEKTMNYITFNISLQTGSTGKSFNVNVVGGQEYVVPIPESSTDVQFVFNKSDTRGTCFTLQFRTVSFGNLTQSEATSIVNTCYASFPATQELLSTKEQMTVAVSCVGGLILLCGVAAVIFLIVRKRRRALWTYAVSSPRQHGKQHIIPHYYGKPRKIPDYLIAYYPTIIRS